MNNYSKQQQQRPPVEFWSKFDFKRVGGQLEGSCPNCGGDDRFHVNLNDGLFGCRKCDDYKAILEASGWQPNGKQWPTRSNTQSWDIRTDEGRTVIHHRKNISGGKQMWWSPKGFKLRNGERYLPYQRGAGESVVIVEGERCVDQLALSVTGYTVLCAGMRGNLRDWVLSICEGKRVVIWPDNDKPGLSKAANIQKIVEPMAAAVCVADPYGASGTGADVVDAIADGVDIQALLDNAVPKAIEGDDIKALKPFDYAVQVLAKDQHLMDRSAYSPGLGWLWWDGHWHRSQEQVSRRVANLRKSSVLTSGYGCARGTRTSALLDEFMAAEVQLIDAVKFDPEGLTGLPGAKVRQSNGIIRNARPADRNTMRAGVIPESGTPDKFLDLLNSMFASLGEHTQTATSIVCTMIGLAFAGEVDRQQRFLFISGERRSGKSTLVSILQHCFGQYSAVLSPQTIEVGNQNQHRTYLAALKGKRLLAANEVSSGKSLDSTQIKTLTGGDEITANHMRMDPIQFTIKGLLLLTGNQLPRIVGADSALLRRLVLLPATECKLPNPNLLDGLKQEGGKIIGYCLEAARRFNESDKGIDDVVPESMKARAQHYIEGEQPDYPGFVAECLELDSDKVCKVRDMEKAFHDYCGGRANRDYRTGLADYLAQTHGIVKLPRHARTTWYEGETRKNMAGGFKGCRLIPVVTDELCT